MKKRLVFFLLFLLTHHLFFPALVDVYRKGTVKIIPDPNFGKGNDWESLFYDNNKTLTVASDGSVFVANVLKNNLFKFSPQGKFLLTVGQRGEGKGDLLFPVDLSVLDNHLIVVGEDPLHSMVSLFNYSGKIDRKIRCNKSVFTVIALKDDKIAYIYMTSANGIDVKNSIFIKDLSTRSEWLVDTLEFQRKGKISLENNSTLRVGGLNDSVILARTREGNLMVGMTNSSVIKIFSPSGRMVKSFNLKLTPIPVTREYIEAYKKSYLDFIKGNKYQRPFPKRIINKVIDFDFATLFNKYLTLYKNFIIDSEGNLLLFPNPTCLQDCKIPFQVYSEDGIYICDGYIEKGEFDFDIDNNRMPFVIHGTSIYGLFERKGRDDISLELIKSDLK